MTSGSLFADVSAIITMMVSFILGLDMEISFAQKRSTHALWWGIAFMVTAVAALFQFLALTQGTWSEGAFRGYVITSAAVPALMGAGSMYLLWRRLAPAYTVAILVFIVLNSLGALTVAANPTSLTNVLKASQEVTRILPSPLVIIGFAVLGTLGAAALVLAALWSYVKTHQSYNLGIAFGGVIFSLGDTLAAYGIPELFFLAEILGVLLIFFAVRASQKPRPVSQPQPSPRES